MCLEKINRISAVVFLLMAGWLSGCEFTPTKINKVVINNTPVNKVAFQWSSVKDTISLISPTDIKFTLTTNNRYVYVMANYGTAPVRKEGTDEWSFTLDPNIIKSGTYNLTVEIKTGTGTGSLLDKSGRELFTTKFTKVLIVYAQSPVGMNITKVEDRDGSLILQWPTYPWKNGQDYLLQRIAEDGIGILSSVTLPIARTSFQDTTYGGGVVRYRLVTRTYQESMVGSVTTYQGKPMPMVKSYCMIAGPSVEIRWNKTAYPANLRKYHILQTNILPVKEWVVTTNPNDTSATLTGFALGSNPIRLVVEVETRGSGLVRDDSRSVYVDFGYHTRHQSVNDLVFTANTSQYYYCNKYNFLALVNNNIVADSFQRPSSLNPLLGRDIALSHDGTALWVSNFNTKFRVNPVTMTMISYGAGLDFCMSGPVTKDHLMLFNLSDPSNCYSKHSKIVLYNALTKTSLDTLTVDPSPTAPAITDIRLSYDDQSLLIQSSDAYRLASFNDTGFQASKTLTMPVTFQGRFINGDLNHLYGFTNNEVLTYDLTTDQFVRVSLSETIVSAKLDEISGWLGGVNQGGTAYLVFDIRTGAKLRDIPLAQSTSLNYSNPQTFYLWNRRLYIQPDLWLDL